MSRHGRAMRHAQVGFDQRTGFKERARRLKSDGEKPGIYTRYPDPPHPSNRLRPPPGPDGLRHVPSVSANDSHPLRLSLSQLVRGFERTGPPQLQLNSALRLRVSGGPS